MSKSYPKTPKNRRIRPSHHRSSEYDSDGEYEENSNFKTFYYSIYELSIQSGVITVDLTKCSSLDDLKKEIASELAISNNKLQFINPPRNILKTIKNSYNFTISVSCSHINIDFLMPNGKKTYIKDCNTKNFNQIMEILGKEGYYYSGKCIRDNFHLFFSGEEIKHFGYPLLSVKSSGTLELKLFGSIVVLNYGGKQFTFSEDEYCYTATTLISKVFLNGQIKIQKLNGELANKLLPTEQYHVKIEIFSIFVDIEKKYRLSDFINIDLMSTVFDVQKKLAEKIQCRYKSNYINPKDLIIYDKYKSQITNLNSLFTNHHNLKGDICYKYIGNEVKNDSHSYYYSNYLKYKTFCYSVSNIHFSHKYINVNIEECQTYDDLKQQIASDLHVSKDQIEFEDLPKEDVKNISNYTELYIQVNFPQPNIDLLLPNGKKIHIKDCYKKSFNDIINKLEKEGYFYSKDCIKNNVRVYLSGEEIPRIQYPFLSINKKSKLELKLIGSTIVLDVGEKQFTFTEKEHSSDAVKLVERHLNAIYEISIVDTEGNYADILISSKNYRISGIVYAEFYDINDNDQWCNINIGFLTNLSEVKKQLAKRLCFIYETPNPEDFIFYDNDKKEIKDLNKPIIYFLKKNVKLYYKNQNLKVKSFKIKNESNSEIERLKQTINNQQSRITQLEHLLEELQNKNKSLSKTKSPQLTANSSIQILSIDQIQKLENIRKIGDNPSGSVYEVCETEVIKKNYIHKIMSEVSYENLRSYVKEHEILKALDHPNIMKTHGIFLSDGDNPPSILLEHYTLSLEDRIKKKKLTNIETVLFLYEIAEGMKYVHFQKIIHRNLNPANIFISDDGLVKIGEFGISKIISPSEQLKLSMNGLNNSMIYIAPEMKEDEKYDEKVDVYSFGILILYLINGGEIQKTTVNKIIRENKIEIPKKFTKYCTTLIKKCTNLDSDERPCFDTICNDIETKFNKMIEITDDEKQEIEEFIEQHKEKIPSYSY